jgi:hypothetical protein
LLLARRVQVTRGSSGAALCQKVGAGAQVTHGGPGAAPSHWGTWQPRCYPEPRGHVAAPELPRAGSGSRVTGTHGGLGAALSREEGAIVLTWSLYEGVPGPQGTDSGPWAHPGRGYKPAGGTNILSPRSLSKSLCVGIPKQWCSTADTR